MLSIYGWGISLEIAHRCLLQDFTYDKSTLVQVMAWCRQATSHYLSQCCPRSLSPYGVTRPKWVKDTPELNVKYKIYRESLIDWIVFAWRRWHVLQNISAFRVFWEFRIWPVLCLLLLSRCIWHHVTMRTNILKAYIIAQSHQFPRKYRQVSNIRRSLVYSNIAIKLLITQM